MLDTPGIVAMAVPPLPRDLASSPLLGKEDGSSPNAMVVKRRAVDNMVKVLAIVFMLPLIYGERLGVKRAVLNFQVPGTQYQVSSRTRQTRIPQQAWCYRGVITQVVLINILDILISKIRFFPGY